MEESGSIGKYKILKNLGEGTQGKVKLCLDTETGKKVAIKIIKKSLFDTKTDFKRKILREIALMRFLDHPHLIKLYQVFESKNHLYMILEYAENGELYSYLVARRFLKPETAMRLFRQLIYAVEFLHTNSICHRDLKPENILLDSNNNIKLCDFGFARWISSSNAAVTSCGSPHYAAPEVIRGHPYDGRCADIWSCGVILYALLAGYLPFDDPSIRNVLMKVKSGVYRPPSTHPLIVDLISKILVVDVNKRFTIKQIKEHPAFTMHLPDGYTLPKPLPPPSVTEKVEVTDEKFFMLLKNIGFESDEAIKEELAAPTSTAAKLFYILYEDKLNIKNLPWKSNEQSSPSSSLSQFLISNESSPFDHQDDMQSSTQSSSMYSSFKESKKWDLPFMEEEEETEEVRTIHFQKITTNYLQLTKVIQSEITKEGYMFFYPDDQTLFVHRMDQESYYTLTINQAINNESELEVCQNYGSQQDFTEFEEIIVRVISEYSFVQQ